jgi:thioredoxin reductase (NADPH)
MTAPDAGSDPYLSPPVDAEQLALLRRYGQERPTTAGQVLFREGDRAYDFIVVLSGVGIVVDHDAGVERELVTIIPGRFLGELGILTGERVFATAEVTEPGSILVIPVDRLQEVIAQDQELSDLIVQTALRRRQWLLQHRAGLRIFGSRSSPDARRLRELAARNHLPHVWVDLDSDPAAGVVLAHHGLGPVS